MDSKYPLALPAGSVLAGQYVIDKVLGQGGFGITYAATDHKTDTKVAVKEFFPESMATRTQSVSVTPFSGDIGESFQYGKTCFLQEAETLAQFIGNENIVKIHCYFEENGTAYFVMDFVEGTSFDRYIKDKGGKISYEETEKYLIPVMDALHAVHNKGIVHRDVTPDNIYITKDGVVKLLDFGAARYSLGDKSRSLDVVLKHGFAPKEQYTRRGRQGPFTDVYALGATFYFALTGKRPPDSIERLDEDNLVPPSTLGVSIPKSAEEAILRAMAVNPQGRFQTMQEFKNALLFREMEAKQVTVGGLGDTSKVVRQIFFTAPEENKNQPAPDVQQITPQQILPIPNAGQNVAQSPAPYYPTQNQQMAQSQNQQIMPGQNQQMAPQQNMRQGYAQPNAGQSSGQGIRPGYAQANAGQSSGQYYPAQNQQMAPNQNQQIMPGQNQQMAPRQNMRQGYSQPNAGQSSGQNMRQGYAQPNAGQSSGQNMRQGYSQPNAGQSSGQNMRQGYAQPNAGRNSQFNYQQNYPQQNMQQPMNNRGMMQNNMMQNNMMQQGRPMGPNNGRGNYPQQNMQQSMNNRGMMQNNMMQNNMMQQGRPMGPNNGQGYYSQQNMQRPMNNRGMMQNNMMQNNMMQQGRPMGPNNGRGNYPQQNMQQPMNNRGMMQNNMMQNNMMQQGRPMGPNNGRGNYPQQNMQLNMRQGYSQPNANRSSGQNMRQGYAQPNANQSSGQNMRQGYSQPNANQSSGQNMRQGYSQPNAANNSQQNYMPPNPAMQDDTQLTPGGYRTMTANIFQTPENNPGTNKKSANNKDLPDKVRKENEYGFSWEANDFSGKKNDATRMAEEKKSNSPEIDRLEIAETNMRNKDENSYGFNWGE